LSLRILQGSGSTLGHGPTWELDRQVGDDAKGLTRRVVVDGLDGRRSHVRTMP